MVHVPRRRAEEAVALQCRGVHAEIFLAHHVGVARHVGNFAESSEQGPVAACSRSGSRFALTRRVALAEQQFDEVVGVGVRGRDGLGETLFVVTLVLPLPGRIVGFGVKLTVHQRQRMIQSAFQCVVGHAQVGDRVAAVRVVAGDVPDDRAAPVVADPHGPLAAQPVQQFQHVADDVFLRVVVVSGVNARTTVTAHVRRHRTKAERRQRRKLMPPAYGELGPAVDEDDERPVVRARGEIKRGVAVGLDGVFGRIHDRCPFLISPRSRLPDSKNSATLRTS